MEKESTFAILITAEGESLALPTNTDTMTQTRTDVSMGQSLHKINPFQINPARPVWGTTFHYTQQLRLMIYRLL